MLSYGRHELIHPLAAPEPARAHPRLSRREDRPTPSEPDHLPHRVRRLLGGTELGRSVPAHVRRARRPRARAGPLRHQHRVGLVQRGCRARRTLGGLREEGPRRPQERRRQLGGAARRRHARLPAPHAAAVPRCEDLRARHAHRLQDRTARHGRPCDRAHFRERAELDDRRQACRGLGSPHASPAKAHGKLDDHQRRCTDLALATPHFAVVKGPPGAGKTTLIEQIVVGTIQRGERVLVVSPTHTAVDNVVEKLLKPTGGGADTLEPKSLPVRYATRAKRLQHAALPAWVGPRSQRRAGSIAERLERRLAATMPLAGALFPRVDPNADGHAPLSAAIASFEPVICGTPIGLLGYASVRDAAPGAFDLLVIDEVSKMTLPEFLAIAVKAKRWVVVGDPEQLPPHVDAGENAVVLADILDPEMELACSAAMALARRKPKDRRLEPLLLVARHPTRAAHALRQQLVTTGLDRSPRVAAFDELEPARRAQRFYGVLVASPEQVDAACRCLDPEHAGLEMLVEQRLGRDLPSVPGLTRIKREERVAAGMFEQSFKAYHALPWANRQRLALPGLACIDELEHAMPTDALLEALDRPADAANTRTALAVRYALCAVSVYDWLVGMPIRDFTVSPLRELAVLDDRALQDMVRPFVGVLEKQYRMAPSISVTPRRLFYFNEALHDGAPKGHDYGTVLEQVRSAPSADGKESAEECARIAEILAELETAAALESAAQNKPAHHDVMVITPYCKQRDRLKQMVDSMSFDHLSVAVQTIDTCQGRDADFVLISLVRPKSTPFLDNPKRWNVAFTRAKRGLFVVGDIEAFRLSARRARGGSPRGASPGRQPMVRMSVLERIIEEIDSVTRTLQKAHHA
ncbi:MAG: AAA domain-containing protein [Planctomycetaceae bacterium]|nr:AAA domain-containing protein [Planctomycetaceae bacterium]